MTKPRFVYVTYIATTPQQLWTALTDSELTKEYWWHHANLSDWKVGSAWKHQDYGDPTVVDIAGKVVESNPPHRLVVTWAFPADVGNAAKTSRVTYQIEPYEGVVRLTVMHEDLEHDSDMLRGITRGWPAVLSSLKTFLETGKPMSTFTQRRGKGPE